VTSAPSTVNTSSKGESLIFCRRIPFNILFGHQQVTLAVNTSAQNVENSTPRPVICRGTNRRIAASTHRRPKSV
jgi:hypothetical protein